MVEGLQRTNHLGPPQDRRRETGKNPNRAAASIFLRNRGSGPGQFPRAWHRGVILQLVVHRLNRGRAVPSHAVGNQLKVAGDRTFEPWSVTVVNDGQFQIRQAFEAWSRGINALTENVAQLGYGADGGASYCVDMTVFQLSRDGQDPSRTPSNPNNVGVDGMEVIRAYKFYDAWPSAVSSIDLSFEANDQIEEFTVEFQYNFFEVTTPAL